MSEKDCIDVEARVRGNTTPSALNAGILIFFGFFVVVVDPQGEGMFYAGENLFLYALRLGGLAMVAVTFLSALGTPYALFIDAIVSGLVGLALCVSAAMFSTASEITLMYGVYFVCGFTMVISGLRNWRDYGELPRVFADDGSSAAAIKAYDPFGDSPAAASSLDASHNQSGEQESAPIALQTKKKSYPRRPSSMGSEDDVISLDDLPGNSHESSKLEPPPPQGYLADLSRKKRPPTRPTP